MLDARLFDEQPQSIRGREERAPLADRIPTVAGTLDEFGHMPCEHNVPSGVSERERCSQLDNPLSH